MNQLDLFGPIRAQVQINQKTVKHTPTDKLYDAWISLLAGAHGLVAINTRLRGDVGLQQAFGRQGCAEQSVVQETLDACTAETVNQMHSALDQIYRQHSQGYRHDDQAAFQWLDVDMSGLPYGPKAAFATRGYFAGQYHRRGRQLGRVLATRSEEVVTDRVCAGHVQLIKALQPLDILHISGFLCFDTFHHVVEMVLNQHSRRAHKLIPALRELLTPLQIVINLGETKELPHAHPCLRLAFPGAVRYRLADHRLAFPPASPRSPSGHAQAPATAEAADTS